MGVGRLISNQKKATGAEITTIMQPRYAEQHHWSHKKKPPTIKALAGHFIRYQVAVKGWRDKNGP